MKVNISFNWNTIDEIPKHTGESILCLTEKGRLCVFKDIERKMWKENGSFIKYSIFENLVKYNRIKYWTYQKDLIPD